jgi:cobalt/nickel transport system permease protein
MNGSEFIERSVATFVRFMARSIESEELAKANGLLQHLDPRVKIIGLPALIVAAVVSHRIAVILSIFGVSVLLASLSRVPLRTLMTRIWLGVLGFSGVIALPAIFITPGHVLYRVPILGWDITAQGVRTAAYLLARTETAATLSLLLVLCTPWAHVMKALRALRVPVVLVVIFGMTYRYIFLLLETAREMFESRRSRIVNTLDAHERRAMAAATSGVLMGKTFQLSNDVYLAMQSRGFNGEVHLLSDFSFSWYDYAGLLAFLSLSAIALWFGR